MLHRPCVSRAPAAPGPQVGLGVSLLAAQRAVRVRLLSRTPTNHPSRVSRLRRPPHVRAAAKDVERLTFDEAKADDDPRPKGKEARADGKGNLSWSAVKRIALPYWTDDEQKSGARWRLAGVLGMTLATTGISVGFNFLGRDFYNSIAEKNADDFQRLLLMYTGAIAAGIPVFVLKDFFRERLSLRWREWMTGRFVNRYFENRNFYRIQTGTLVDNPDQRINDDVAAFTGAALSFTLVLFNSAIDLASFSGILYSIYPPLFAALLVYAIGGTWLTVQIGKVQVGLNFEQETKEANFRYSLMRIRENSESIAFYGGEQNEKRVLLDRFRQAIDNLSELIVAGRNLNVFTTYYKYLISFLPAAVVAPLYFKGEIEFGVINQSASAFNHILNDFSLVVYQFESIAGFSAVVERLSQFEHVLDSGAAVPSAVPKLLDPTAATSTTQQPPAGPSPFGLPVDESGSPSTGIELVDCDGVGFWDCDVSYLLQVDALTLRTPNNANTLIQGLTFTVAEGEQLLIMGPSGSGKTSLLRALAGLWQSGAGSIRRQTAPSAVFFVPQRPYMVLGSLREQLLYPTWTECDDDDDTCETTRPPDEDLIRALRAVRLEKVVAKYGGLDSIVEWSTMLSLGEQQRLAFARLLLARPSLALLDESTSALDVDNEAYLYGQMRAAGISFISVGHRPSLVQFHSRVLRLGNGPSAWSVKTVGDGDLAEAMTPAVRATPKNAPPGYVPDPSYWEV